MRSIASPFPRRRHARRQRRARPRRRHRRNTILLRRPSPRLPPRRTSAASASWSLGQESFVKYRCPCVLRRCPRRAGPSHPRRVLASLPRLPHLQHRRAQRRRAARLRHPRCLAIRPHECSARAGTENLTPTRTSAGISAARPCQDCRGAKIGGGDENPIEVPIEMAIGKPIKRPSGSLIGGRSEPE